MKLPQPGLIRTCVQAVAAVLLPSIVLASLSGRRLLISIDGAERLSLVEQAELHLNEAAVAISRRGAITQGIPLIEAVESRKDLDDKRIFGNRWRYHDARLELAAGDKFRRSYNVDPLTGSDIDATPIRFRFLNWSTPNYSSALSLRTNSFEYNFVPGRPSFWQVSEFSHDLDDDFMYFGYGPNQSLDQMWDSGNQDDKRVKTFEYLARRMRDEVILQLGPDAVRSPQLNQSWQTELQPTGSFSY